MISRFSQTMGLDHVCSDLDGHISFVTKSIVSSLPASLLPPPLVPCFTVRIQLRVKRSGTQQTAAGSTFAQPGRPFLSRKNRAAPYVGATNVARRRGALFFCWVCFEQEHNNTHPLLLPQQSGQSLLAEPCSSTEWPKLFPEHG